VLLIIKNLSKQLIISGSTESVKAVKFVKQNGQL